MLYPLIVSSPTYAACSISWLIVLGFFIVECGALHMSRDGNISLYVDHSTEIVDHIAALFKTKDFTDITLIVGGTRFPAHRVILASRCEYFRALLFGGLAETHSSIIHLNGISPSAFFHVIEYIYTGKLCISSVTIEDAFDVLGLVCQYNFPDLQNDLTAHFIRSLTLQNVYRSPAVILAHPQFLHLSRASVVRMFSRDSFYVPEVEVLRGVQAWLEADYHSRFEKFAALIASSSLPSVSVSSDDQQQQQQLKLQTTTANTFLLPAPPCSPVARKIQLTGHALLPSTRSNSSESLFSSASTPDSVTSGGAKSKTSDAGQATLEEVRAHLDRETADARSELIGCIRFELMSLTELSTEVRASHLLSPDDLLDKIGAKMKATFSQLPIRGRLLPEINIAVPRLGCSLIKGQWGNYPFFFVDSGDTLNAVEQSHQVPRRHRRDNQSRAVWDASSDWMIPLSRPFDREVQLRGRGDALANASAWGFMDNVAISTAAGWSASGVPQADSAPPILLYQNRDAASGPLGAAMHLNSWLRNTQTPAAVTSVTARNQRTPHEPPPESELSVVSHLIGVRDDGIVVDLGHNSFVNFISMQLWDREPRSYSYYVEVSQSLDESSWQKVVDYSNYACRSWQTLYFPERIIRYIRIVGTRSSVGKYFHLITFQCLYTRQKFTVQNDLLVPQTNVATIHRGATVLEGVSRLRNSLIDGDVSVYNLNYGFTCHQLGNGSIDVQLSQPFLVSSMRFLLWDLDSRAYSYIVEVSQDRLSWTVVFDATQLLCRSWQTIKFPLQLVTFIRITGTGNTANDVFHLVHLECPAAAVDVPSDDLMGEADHGGVQQRSSSQSTRAQLISPPTDPAAGVSDASGGSSGAVESSGPSVYVDTVSILRHQRPRLLEVEEPSTPSSSLVADLSTFSLHSEATLDAAGTETTGNQSLDAVPPPLAVAHHQRRRRRRHHHNSRQQRPSVENEDSTVPNAATSTITGANVSAANFSLHYFSGNSRTTSLSSVTRNDIDGQPITYSNIEGGRNQTGLPLLRKSSDSSLDSSDSVPSKHS
ncbi:BTB/POZ domain-containing protein 9 [Echinococcus granulosus]|uniref:BTB:POZ domain containing protein 9 n=1 Tax=Echinococcus granulosus TaxID=6210 RepID=A0A068WSF9_ECHGR|nr:BTB/POZ domain-containing protein 9 [Echinococcus granulosus]CDS23085.1 BTB:POZ domain containing protein 9 [Echinococcus granulosus]